jgi:hypothetical protein
MNYERCDEFANGHRSCTLYPAVVNRQSSCLRTGLRLGKKGGLVCCGVE